MHPNHDRAAAAPAVFDVLLIASGAIHCRFGRLTAPGAGEVDGLNGIHMASLVPFADNVGRARRPRVPRGTNKSLFLARLRGAALTRLTAPIHESEPRTRRELAEGPTKAPNAIGRHA